MTAVLDERRRKSLSDYQALVDRYPGLFAQRVHRRLVLDRAELVAFMDEHDAVLGVAVETPQVYFLMDLVESRRPDGTPIRYPYLRVVLRGQLDGGFNVVVVGVIADAALGRIGDIIVLRQERHATGTVELELPRGFGEAGLPLADNALKELQEETGYVGREARVLGTTLTDSGITDAAVHYVQVPVVARAVPMPDAHEAITGVQLMSPAEIWSAVRAGRIRDGFTLQAIALWEKFGQA